MCGGCSSDNNQTNMTFQVLGAGMIFLSVEMSAGCVPCGFRAGSTTSDGDSSGRRRQR
jgi:hypothetical protein